MYVAMATEPAKPGQPNEDYAGATTDTFVVVDGAGTPAGSDSGCLHGVAWFARQLGSALLHQASAADESLADALAASIDHVADLHRDTCDLSHPGTPSGTVTAVRVRDERIEYLALADSPLVIRRRDGAIHVITDDREAQVGRQYRRTMDATAAGTPEHAAALREYVEALRGHRNQPGGFWVASTDPRVANEAITGHVETSDVRDLALLSDGASRRVDRFGLDTWGRTLDLSCGGGPEAVIAAVREAEASDVDGLRWPRGKSTDDATIIHLAQV